MFQTLGCGVWWERSGGRVHPVFLCLNLWKGHNVLIVLTPAASCALRVDFILDFLEKNQFLKHNTSPELSQCFFRVSKLFHSFGEKIEHKFSHPDSFIEPPEANQKHKWTKADHSWWCQLDYLWLIKFVVWYDTNLTSVSNTNKIRRCCWWSCLFETLSSQRFTQTNQLRQKDVSSLENRARNISIKWTNHSLVFAQPCSGVEMMF